MRALVRVADARALLRQRVSRWEGGPDREDAGGVALVPCRAERPALSNEWGPVHNRGYTLAVRCLRRDSASVRELRQGRAERVKKQNQAGALALCAG